MYEVPPQMRRLIYIVIAAAAAAGFVGGLAASLVVRSGAWRGMPIAVAASGQVGPASFAPIARAVSPSVVNIDTVVMQRVSPFGMPFDLFFGDPFERVVPREGSASGVIVRGDGYILTNQHVVEDARRIAVTLADGRRFDARVVGQDRPSDLAVLKIDVEGLRAAALGDSDTLEAGDWVVAIGNPFGFQHTITVGVVSALGRPIYVEEEGRRYEDLIQTDAYINRGNSGGPLVDAGGAVVGINTAIVSAGQGAPMGFAIPINSARRIKDELIARGRVSRSWIGVNFARTITPELARQYDLPTERGAMVGGTTPGGPAARAGLRRYDIVAQIGDTHLSDTDQAGQVIVTAPVGTRLNLRVWRPAREVWEQHVVSVVTEEAPSATGTSGP